MLARRIVLGSKGWAQQLEKEHRRRGRVFSTVAGLSFFSGQVDR
jgi:hypothetical protein